MTRKDYEMIAQAVRDGLADGRRDPASTEAAKVAKTIAQYVSDGLAADNLRFDRKRFMAACGFNA